MEAIGHKALGERMSNLPLRWRIGALVLLGLVGIFGLFGLLGSALAQDGRQRTIDQWMSLTTSTARFIDSEVRSQFDRLDALSTRVGAAPSDPIARAKVLADGFAGAGSFVADSFLLDRDGAITWSKASEPDGLAVLVAADPRIRELLVAGDRYASSVARLAGRAAVILAVPAGRSGCSASSSDPRTGSSTIWSPARVASPTPVTPSSWTRPGT